MKASLPVKLSLWVGTIFTLVFFSLAGFLAYKWYGEIEKSLDSNGMAAVQTTAYRLDQIFLQAKLSAELIARGLKEKPYSKDEIPDFMQEMVTAFHAECPEIVGMAIAYEDGMLVPGERYNGFVGFIRDKQFQLVHWNDDKTNYFERNWYRDPIREKKSLWTKPFKAEAISGETLSSFAVPFYLAKNGKQTLAGVVVIDITVGTLEQYLSAVSPPGTELLNESKRTILINNSDLIVAAPGREYLHNQNFRTLCTSEEESNTLSKLFLRNKGKYLLPKSSFRPEKCELYYARCLNGWIVGATIPANWRSRLLLPLFLRLLLIGLCFIIIVVWIIFKVCTQLNKPLLKLSQLAIAVGNGHFDTPIPECNSKDEIAVVTDSFRRMQIALADYIDKLKNSIRERERTEGELNAAYAIQKDILPHILPLFQVFDEVTGSANLIPARSVGGDLYDIFPVNKNKLALIIGDVSGKGVSAALFMAVTQILQRNIALTEQTPSGLTMKLNDMLYSNNTSNMFVTYWVGFLDINTGELTYTNAGHNPPILRHADGHSLFLKDRHGIPLGIMTNKTYTETTIKLNPSDIIICYTNGVTEAVNKNLKMFGEKRLLNTIQEIETNSPRTLLNHIECTLLDYTKNMEKTDDITLLVTRFKTLDVEYTEQTFAARVSAMSDVMTFVMNQPEFANFNPKKQYQLQLSIEEIFVNIAHYAYPNEPGTVNVAVGCEDNQFRIRFTDSGIPFNPLEKDDPDISLALNERKIGGLGIFIVKKMTDFINYHYRDGNNILTIGKFLDVPIVK